MRTKKQIADWWKAIDKAAANAPEVVPATPRVNFCWYCSRQLRNKAFTEIEVDGASRTVHKQCAKWIQRGDMHEAEHPEQYGLSEFTKPNGGA